MKKSLYDLSKEEWNTFFPVKLVEHDPNWKSVFEKEKTRIITHLDSDIILRIEHFGSTSIPSIKAKPYIDLLIEIPEKLLFTKQLIAQFEDLGYYYFKVPARENIDSYMSFGKGYKLEGNLEQVFHIHMCPEGNIMWDQLNFRDYLIDNPRRAKQYEQVKLDLATKHKNDRGSYMLGKTNFIRETLVLAQSK